MNIMNILTATILLTVFVTAAALVTGIASMAHGGAYDRKHSHRFMFLRVGFQGLTLALLFVALVLSLR